MDNLTLLPLGIWLQHYGILLVPILYFVFKIEQQITDMQLQIKELRAISTKSDERWLELTKEFVTNKSAAEVRLHKIESKLKDGEK